MSIVTINRVDDHVVIDGEARVVDCSTLPLYVSVIQWSDENLAGWVEFVNDGHGVFLPNNRIIDFSPYQYLVAAWEQAEPPEEHVVNKAAPDGPTQEQLEQEQVERKLLESSNDSAA